MKRTLLVLTVLVAATASFAMWRGGGSVLACDSDDGLVLPEGFCATVVADLSEAGLARGVEVAPDGTIYVSAMPWAGRPGGVWALRDRSGDGRPEVRERITDDPSTGLVVRGGMVYVGTREEVVRYRLRDDGLRAADREVLVRGLPGDGEHTAKKVVVSGDDLFVTVGSSSNACQESNRTPGSPGLDPCPELADRAGIWRFDADRPGQTMRDGERWATGLRSVVAFAQEPRTGALFGVQHGRDDLGRDWPAIYSAEDEARKPAEEMVRIDRGDDFGWPRCIYDLELGRKVLSPDYGGDGSRPGPCTAVEEPLLAFPGHWGPNGLLFPRGARFPERYRGGAFVAFHGPENRTPHAPDGLRVVFVPFSDGAPTGTYETVIDGFAGAPTGTARYRPMGLAEGPDGSLYVLENQRNRLWRVFPTALAGQPGHLPTR